MFKVKHTLILFTIGRIPFYFILPFSLSKPVLRFREALTVFLPKR
jgi:hypothetical protein